MTMLFNSTDFRMNLINFSPSDVEVKKNMNLLSLFIKAESTADIDFSSFDIEDIDNAFNIIMDKQNYATALSNLKSKLLAAKRVTHKSDFVL